MSRLLADGQRVTMRPYNMVRLALHAAYLLDAPISKRKLSS